MRNSIFTGLVALAAVGGLSACDSFVEDTDPPIDRVVSDSLDTVSQVPFLITGVEEGFNDAYDATAVVADLLSDAAIFDTDVRNATFPTFDDIDDGEIENDNNSIDGPYNAVNEYRFLADDLLRRTNETIDFGDDEEGQRLRDQALYAANFHGGIARYFLGTYFGTGPTTGGAPISDDPDNPSPASSTAELYAAADAKLAAALAVAPDDYERRVINTLRARIALFSGDRSAAASFAANGLTDGDEPYTGDYASTSANDWWASGGRGRTQVAVAPRFAAYDEVDDRTLVEPAPKVDNPESSDPFYRQALYLTDSASIPFVSWQENALILAEAALNGAGGGDATALINAVRASRGIDALDGSADQDDLLEARDRELFTQGQRLVDQRRFNLPFTNLDGALPGPWRFFPITQTEVNANPNL
ncbi:RagB/SusD family nutrient uptake outer membrane protein [Rubrivirga marina]|uniref:RagB/SusD domain-containing protein n=1 Tax=Rubrivirga marina TaxID=1196024 RepID=A0A271J0F3_9BACT|nr:RagB/SusD family nutrient uptake outer membrane protein [Rubrivirga marina]PAP76991.1 hypothetical protein BSZ37_11380 [Rubrivirga marina]